MATSEAQANARRPLPALETLRGVAAVMVFGYHLVNLLEVAAPPGMRFVATHFGLGVPLFYTLSGFVLTYGFADSLEGRQRILAFYLRRFFRIAPLFYVMLGVWLVVNYVGFHNLSTLQAVFLNVSFLFGLVPGAHESIVWAGWSIGIEMLFYLLFPVLALFTTGVASSLVVFALALCLSSACESALGAMHAGGFAYMNLCTHLGFFTAGMLCARIWQSAGARPRPSLGWALMVSAALIAAATVGYPPFYLALSKLPSPTWTRNVWSLIFSSAILGACFANATALQRGPLHRIGTVSFSLYLLHPLIMAGLGKLRFGTWVASLTPQPHARFAIAFLLTLACVWLASEVSFRLIESPGVTLGRRLSARVRGGEAPKPVPRTTAPLTEPVAQS